MNEEIDYDKRQITLMKSIIKAYKEGNRSLIYLINDLESLFNCLKIKNDDWNEVFLKEWSNLEIIYASSAANGDSHVSDSDFEVIKESLMIIEDLLDSRELELNGN